MISQKISLSSSFPYIWGHTNRVRISNYYAFNKRFNLTKVLVSMVCFILISGCTSLTLLDQPIVDHWNGVKTQKHLLATWSGVSPSGDQISYQFNSDDTCVWTYSNIDIGCKFKVREHENGYRVLIYEMAGEQFQDVEFIAWVKIDLNEMIIYGYPTKFGRKQSGEKAMWPDTFPNDSIILTDLEFESKSDTFSNQEFLREMAKMYAKKLPLKLDELTRFDEVKIYESVIEKRYTLLNSTKEDVDISSFKQMMTSYLSEQSCINKYSLIMYKRGISEWHTYADEHGKLICTVKIDGSICK